MMMSRAVQQLMWFELLFQTQGQVLPGWTEWILVEPNAGPGAPPSRFACYPGGCAAPGNVPCQCNSRGALSKLEGTPPQRKIDVTSKSPVGDISVVTLIRTDTTLDHSQKAEKVCY